MNILKWRTRGEASREVQHRAEHRGYTDVVTNALLEHATNALADGYSAGLEIAAGQLSRAFISATVEGADARAFTPSVMGEIGRSLVESGQAAWLRTGRRIERAENFGVRPDGRIELSFPTGSVAAGPERVFLVRWNRDLASGYGISPLNAAATLKDLLSRLESALAQEASAAVGYLLPIPADGDGSTVDQLKTDLAGLKGRIAVVETTRGGWDGSAAPRRDFELARMGPAPPGPVVDLMRHAEQLALAACGYPVQLATDSDGTSQREAWRRYLHGTVAPLGRLVVEAAAVARLSINVSFDALFASDIQGRARAFQSMVAGGMDIAQAAAASGILNEGE